MVGTKDNKEKFSSVPFCNYSFPTAAALYMLQKLQFPFMILMRKAQHCDHCKIRRVGNPLIFQQVRSYKRPSILPSTFISISGQSMGMKAPLFLSPAGLFLASVCKTLFVQFAEILRAEFNENHSTYAKFSQKGCFGMVIANSDPCADYTSSKSLPFGISQAT